MTPANMSVVANLKAYAEERGRTLVELAFSWVFAKPQVACVMAGATRPEQVDQNAAAVGWDLTAEEIADIERIAAAAEIDAGGAPRPASTRN
jgi:aryl-alcohol dehydrogenase-like predicted oxidoreductase